MKSQEQLDTCEDPTEKAVPGSEHLGSIQGNQFWVTGTGVHSLLLPVAYRG